MNKEEFETMVGKEVSYDTFRMYEAMYMACPESVTKQKFVEMLNISAIPESKEAIERREEAKRFEAKIKEEIEAYKKSIKLWKEDIDNLRFNLSLYKMAGTKDDIQNCRWEIKNAAEQIAWNKQKIRDLEFVLA